MKVQFTFHPERCVGCGACIMACINENNIDVDERSPYRLLKQNEYVDKEKVDIIYFTHACMHCKERPCAVKCPKECYTYDKETGINELDATHCVGCHACQKVCPYEAIQFTKENKAAKCNGCIKNLQEDKLPLCVLACPRKAITIDEKNDVLEAGRESLRRELNQYHKGKRI